MQLLRKWFARKEKEQPAAPAPPVLWPGRFVRGAALGAGALVVLFLALYIRYALVIQQRLGQGGFPTGTMLYAAPRILRTGDPVRLDGIIAHLQRAGYREDPHNRIGTYRRIPSGIEITTGRESYFQPHTAEIHISGGRIARIYSHTTRSSGAQFQLEPELITNLVKADREKRRPVSYAELPRYLIEALVATEDKRFFEHGGFDLFRILKAAYIDLREGRKQQGASTLTMQLARSLWLEQDKTWRRKFAEFLLTIELERRFRKEQILEFYANEVYLGRRGSFSIHGFGQAARSYFAKDVKQLTLPEAAMLVAMIQRPGYYNPFRYPERVRERRNLVLSMMRSNGYLSAEQLASASAAPVRLSPAELESTDAPYFVDLANDDLERRLQDADFRGNTFRVYTTLDLDLQREAAAAVRAGMSEVDRNLRRRRRHAPLPQVALVALDPRTGAVRALLGGRDYAQSQLNRAVAARQPGSAFKPFVYAAALNTAVAGGHEVLTAATRLDDVPTVFRYANQTYEPANFGGHFYGSVTLRQALAKSLNVATVKLAERVGYDAVVRLAREAGLNSNLQATPAIALGAYEVRPLEIAQAYTMFANQGRLAESHWIASLRDRRNRIVFNQPAREHAVLDPRVAYLMVNLMQEVLRSGTGAGVRGRGFTLPAAGKTGTSRDGWFAGFTSDLLCVVWVGHDNGRELGLEGAKSALPVWTEFMRRAHQLPQYRDPHEFERPEGIVTVNIDPSTGLRATEACPWVSSEVFIAGTQPRQECYHYQDFEYLYPEQRRSVLGRIFEIFRR